MFDLEDLSRNTGSSDRCVNEYVVLEDFYFFLLTVGYNCNLCSVNICNRSWLSMLW